MTTTLLNSPRSLGLTALGLGLAVTVAAFAPPPDRDQAQASTDDPLSLFTRTFPVYTHPRCLNCHGNTLPDSSRNHNTPDFEAGMACTSCHVDEPDWRLGPGFVNLTARQLCENLAEVVHTRRPAGFLRHLDNDRLILQAFGGLAGGARTAPAPLPPMPHTAFREAARAWVEDGLGLCDREGEIQHTESINTNTTYHQGGSGETNVRQSGSRTVRVRFAGGRYVSNVQVTGSITITQTLRLEVNGVPCQTIITTTTNYADKDDPGPEQSNLGITALARVAVEFESGNTYKVTVRLPEESHQQIDGGSVQNGCGTALPAPEPEAQTMTWPGTSFVFRGTLPGPNHRGRLVGSSTRTINTRISPDEDPWLHDHYAAAAPLEGTTLLPVTVATRWNIQYRP